MRTYQDDIVRAVAGTAQVAGTDGRRRRRVATHSETTTTIRALGHNTSPRSVGLGNLKRRTALWRMLLRSASPSPGGSARVTASVARSMGA